MHGERCNIFSRHSEGRSRSMRDRRANPARRTSSVRGAKPCGPLGRPPLHSHVDPLLLGAQAQQRVCAQRRRPAADTTFPFDVVIDLEVAHIDGRDVMNAHRTKGRYRGELHAQKIEIASHDPELILTACDVGFTSRRLTDLSRHIHTSHGSTRHALAVLSQQSRTKRISCRRNNYIVHRASVVSEYARSF